MFKIEIHDNHRDRAKRKRKQLIWLFYGRVARVIYLRTCTKIGLLR